MLLGCLYFIGGRQVTVCSRRTREAVQRIDGTVHGYVPLGPAAAIGQATESARLAQPRWAATNSLHMDEPVS